MSLSIFIDGGLSLAQEGKEFENHVTIYFYGWRV